MSSGWSVFIIVITLGNILGCWWLLRHYAKSKKSDTDQPPEEETTGHVWDEDLREYNNPLPRWWLGLFYITVIFALVYLVLYPGLGGFAGVLNWDQEKRYENEVERIEARYAELYDRYAGQPIPELARNDQAMQTSHRLFINNCATCHGSDARGASGFPNLRDEQWLWGGSPEAIKQSILQGRTGSMPPWGSTLGEDGVAETAAYVRKLAGRHHNLDLVDRGEEQYATYCVACHGPEGRGNQALGAPDLTNDIWLYGGDLASIKQSIRAGRSGEMPAHEDLLGAKRIHVLAAYVYSLSDQ
jgi:cytochrome c oxidase cbb3-type subunit 3